MFGDYPPSTQPAIVFLLRTRSTQRSGEETNGPRYIALAHFRNLRLSRSSLRAGPGLGMAEAQPEVPGRLCRKRAVPRCRAALRRAGPAAMGVALSLSTHPSAPTRPRCSGHPRSIRAPSFSRRFRSRPPSKVSLRGILTSAQRALALVAGASSMVGARTPFTSCSLPIRHRRRARSLRSFHWETTALTASKRSDASGGRSMVDVCPRMRG